jgi:2-polyprenyl-3-methyl-5-hydroxy-6-metoxy-1,4-benzoquinol methylase
VTNLADTGPEYSSDALAGRLFEGAIQAMELITVFMGDRLGLYKALDAAEAMTPMQLATQAGVDRRYAREWMEQQAVAGLISVDDPQAPEDERVYRLPAEHAAALVDLDSPYSAAPLARLTAGLAMAVPGVMDAFRSGGGVSWASYGPHVIESQGDFNRPWLRSQLVSDYLAAIPDIHVRLNSDPPARVLDMATGVGWAGISIAQGYPKVSVTGVDVDASSIELARALATEQGVADRVDYVLQDGASPIEGPFDLALIIESVHDMSNPVGVLSSVRGALARGASLVVADEAVAPEFFAPGDEVERFMYAASVLCCLPAGMSETPSAATGTVMRPHTLERYAREAGYGSFEILDGLEHPFFRFYRLSS